MLWQDLLPQIVQRAASRPYASRIRKAFFRGSMGTPDRAAARPFMEQHRDVLDFESNGTLTSSRDFSKWYAWCDPAVSCLPPSTPAPTNPNYIHTHAVRRAVQVYMAGNGYSGRLRYLLATGSPIVYYMGTERGLMHEYFFSRMEPWVHYAPAWHPDQMAEVARYLLDNTAVAEEMGRRGQAFALRFLAPDAISCYFHYMWRALARKSSGGVTRTGGSMRVPANTGDIIEQYMRLTTIARRAFKGDPYADVVLHQSEDFVPYIGPP